MLTVEPRKWAIECTDAAGRSKSVDAVVRPRFTRGRYEMADRLTNKAKEELKAGEQRRQRQFEFYSKIGRDCWAHVRELRRAIGNPIPGRLSEMRAILIGM